MIKTAISFRVPEKLWNDFKVQTDDLFLSRAPFLDYMIQGELEHLREDLAGRRLSLRAKRHISGRLKRMGATSKNIEVDVRTADALRSAIAEHNLVRDAFMCRLIIFLRSIDSLLDFLDIPREVNAAQIRRGLCAMPASPLRAMEAIEADPLYYIRNQVRDQYGCGIYSVALPRKLDWAACHLDDAEIPDTRAYRRKQKEDHERQKEDHELLQSLDLHEPASKPTASNTGKGSR